MSSLQELAASVTGALNGDYIFDDVFSGMANQQTPWASEAPRTKVREVTTIFARASSDDLVMGSRATICRFIVLPNYLHISRKILFVGEPIPPVRSVTNTLAA